MIPILYERGETAFTSNGLGRLPDCGMCQVTEERNGIFEVQFTYPVTGHNYENIREGRIILCTHDESGVAQPFDIYARTQPIDGVVTFYAHHISYRLSRIILKPFTATNCPAALAEMQTQTYNPNPFTFWTDKTSSGSFSVTVPQPVREALGGQAGSILDAFGKGDYEWDRFTVKLWQSRGRETGVTIRYGVNMTDYNRDINYWEAYSGAVPYWTDPETGEMVTPGVVYAEGYDASNAEVIAMDLSEEWETKPTEAQVSARALKRMRDNKSWLPTDNITVSFAQLWQTEEYAAVAPLQRLRLCDRVNVVYGPGGVAVNNVQIIRVVWDALQDRYDSMELGTARASFEQMIRQEVTDEVLKIVPTKSFLQAAIDYATDLINGGLGGHLVVNTDADGHPNELLIMDTDDISNAVNVWRWNLNGLGHSHNGYNGPFDDVAITMDGKINASMIVTGFMSAARLRGGTIDGESVNAKLFNIIDADGNVIASFNDTITIGQESAAYMQMDYRSFNLFDSDGDNFLSFGDARGTDGLALCTDTFIANGATSVYNASAQVVSIISVLVDGTPPTSYRYDPAPGDYGWFVISPLSAKGSLVEVTYKTNMSITHYDLGYRAPNTSQGNLSVIEGRNNTASGALSHAEGNNTSALAQGSHSEGHNTQAKGEYCHAEGEYSQATGDACHAEGYGTMSGGVGSHAEGERTSAQSVASHAEGIETVANHVAQHVFGIKNVIPSTGDYVEIVGGGNQISANRVNIRTLSWAGNEWIAGTLTQASDQRLKDECGEVPDVSGIKARMFKWNDRKLRHDDKVHLGYFAQDVEKVAPYLVAEDDMGYKSLDYIGFLVAKVASLEARVAQLEKEG